jgi:hypothetical protein
MVANISCFLSIESVLSEPAQTALRSMNAAENRRSAQGKKAEGSAGKRRFPAMKRHMMRDQA